MKVNKKHSTKERTFLKLIHEIIPIFKNKYFLVFKFF